MKDNLSGARQRVLECIKDRERRGGPSTITLYAIRDGKGEEREAVLDVNLMHVGIVF
jgi:hypothetical protein